MPTGLGLEWESYSVVLEPLSLEHARNTLCTRSRPLSLFASSNYFTFASR